MPAGRKTKYTPETVKRITDALSVGAARVHACWYAGVSEDSFARWMEGYADFADAVKKAEGSAVVKWQAVIEKAAVDNWQAAAWKLERRYPRDYGRQVIEHDGKSELTVKVVYADVNTDAP